MRRWFLQCSCSFVLGLDVQRCPTTTRENFKCCSSRAHSSKGTVSFGIDQGKLDLALNLHTADFGAMVKATKAALAKERKWKENIVGEAITVKDTTLEIEATVGAPTLSEPIADSDNDDTCTLRESRAVHGIVGAGAAHDTNSMGAVRRQRMTEGGRYGLMDALRDCLLAGNWAKAMRFFETAVETSCKMEQDTSSVVTATQIEGQEPLEVVRRINATTPPGMLFSGQFKHHGILRWNGGHFYLLLKLLLSRHRVVEAERVWDVMKRIGFVEFHMDAFTLNRCIALANKFASPDIVSQLSYKHTNTDDKMKVFRRTFLLELEEWAKKKEVVLNGQNKRATRAVYLAEMINNDKQEGEDKKQSGTLDGQGLKVGDFSGLLRRCTSEESTARVLQMMDKLQVPRDGQIFSALISALRQPHYRLTGEKNVEGEGNTKSEYDDYREKRRQCARQLFEKCPENERTADVYNEMLQISRGSEEAEKDFERLLGEFRGAPLPSLSVAEPENDDVAYEKRDEKKNTEGQLEVKLLPPHWKVPPNGRTYEIMISHCKHLRQWPLIWKLYDEMMEQSVKGTPRLYQTLLEVATRNPPPNREANTMVMELYEDMRGCGVDVTGIKSTVSVVNAWSATRRRRRW